MTELKRREFLKASAAFAAASAAGGFGCVEIASAAPIQAPTVDQLTIRVLVDGSYNLFLRPAQIKNVKVEPAPRQTDYRRALHNHCRCSSTPRMAAKNTPSWSTSVTRRKRSLTTWRWSVPIRKRSKR